ncbi:MAG: phosphatidate cytidylyltransferase [Chlorobiales bacterium]|nr:phosphatidate cytidylyltransferase [Chlorobiales bacterium]
MKHEDNFIRADKHTQIDYKNELARKAIHLSSISIPIIYYHITRELALTLLIPMFLGFLLVDLLKLYVKPVSRWYHKNFSSMLRPHELDENKKQLNGATYVSLSACLVVILFPKMIAIAAFSILIISDSLAALVGRRIGRHKIGTKTLEGSIAFLVSAILIAVFTPNLNLTVGIMMSVVATIVELSPIGFRGHQFDDNLTIPMISGGFAYAWYLLLLPSALPLISLAY